MVKILDNNKTDKIKTKLNILQIKNKKISLLYANINYVRSIE